MPEAVRLGLCESGFMDRPTQMVDNHRCHRRIHVRQPLVATLVPAAESRWRAGLIATQILGVAWCRFVLRLPPMVKMTRAEIVDWIGPTIQRYLGLPDS
jgi:Tetracyclin repressor-like, C-terminal domain